MSVNNKDILRVWWGFTGLYPSALTYHVLSMQCVGMHVRKCVLSKQLDV